MVCLFDWNKIYRSAIQRDKKSSNEPYWNTVEFCKTRMDFSLTVELLYNVQILMIEKTIVELPEIPLIFILIAFHCFKKRKYNFLSS